MVKNLLSLNNELIIKITLYLDFYSKYKLSKTHVEIRKYIINDRKFQLQYKSHASNFIKFWWLSRKIGNDTSICIIKNNHIVDNDIINMVIDNFICIYDPNNLTNAHYHSSCKEYNQSILYNYRYSVCDCLSNKKQYNKVRKQFVTLSVLPFIVQYLKNKYNECSCLNYEIYKTIIRSL